MAESCSCTVDKKCSPCRDYYDSCETGDFQENELDPGAIAEGDVDKENVHAKSNPQPASGVSSIKYPLTTKQHGVEGLIETARTVNGEGQSLNFEVSYKKKGAVGPDSASKIFVQASVRTGEQYDESDLDDAEACLSEGNFKLDLQRKTLKISGMKLQLVSPDLDEQSREVKLLRGQVFELEQKLQLVSKNLAEITYVRSYEVTQKEWMQHGKNVQVLSGGFFKVQMIGLYVSVQMDGINPKQKKMTLTKLPTWAIPIQNTVLGAKAFQRNYMGHSVPLCCGVLGQLAITTQGDVLWEANYDPNGRDVPVIEGISAQGSFARKAWARRIRSGGPGLKTHLTYPDNKSGNVIVKWYSGTAPHSS
eukprot:g44418.t1